MINNFSRVISDVLTIPVYFYTKRKQMTENVNTAQRSQLVVDVASLHHSWLLSIIESYSDTLKGWSIDVNVEIA